MFKTKLRAKLVGEVVEAIALINHPMASGLQRPGQNTQPPRCHHITEIIAEHNGQTVFTAHWNGSVARNPFLRFHFRGAQRGDALSLRWIDTDGDRGATRTTVS